MRLKPLLAWQPRCWPPRPPSPSAALPPPPPRPRTRQPVRLPRRPAARPHRQDDRDGPRHLDHRRPPGRRGRRPADDAASSRRIGVVVAAGHPKAQIQAVRSQPGVTYVEGGASRSTSSRRPPTPPPAAPRRPRRSPVPTAPPLTGKGVSVAVIDSGVDPTHPYFKEADGSSAVVANLKALCEPLTETCSVQRLPTIVDTDTLSVGGHGTHVSGIVAGRPTTLTDGGKLQGAAPGAKLVSISTGAGIVILGADSALNWVLENHEAPCGAGVPGQHLPADQGHQQLLRPDRRRRVRPRVGHGQAPAGPRGRGRRHGLGRRQRRRRRLRRASPTRPARTRPAASSRWPPTTTRTPAPATASSPTSARAALATDASTWPDISAPGENITSSCRLYLAICSTGLDFRNGPGPLDIGTFNTISGTSMAAPHIAGIVAQLFQADPTATPAEIERALKVSAHKFTDGAAYQAGAARHHVVRQGPRPRRRRGGRRRPWGEPTAEAEPDPPGGDSRRATGVRR